MKIGVTFPQTEIGDDPGAIKAYAQAAESLGYDHILAYDHVVGANPDTHPDLTGPYRHTHMFHEPFVLFGFLAGVTETIGLASGIVILPQRQTVLVAKQAAAADVLSRGRLRLGIGTGWNPVEYEALGQNFQNRGRRSEEQIDVLRRLWTEPLVTFEGRWHKIDDAGLNPLPVQRPIPIWLGGGVDAVARRVGRIADGWILTGSPDDSRKALVEKMRASAVESGRDPGSIGLEGWVTVGDRPIEDCVQDALAWKEMGATHLSFNTMNSGLETPQAHIDAI
ncbi:MAG: LLM class F420-dependent oxidoreductase, partial [Chloroflexi bacterium]|nr:LLM class F420-dependent oxidoreductase [Chloroflexota bacterium]